jgi:tetratricopeptide (TPR) repeat protein
MSNAVRSSLCLVVLLTAATLRAQEITIGQRVVVVRDRVAIQAGAQTVDLAHRGDVLQVVNINASWVLVSRGHAGWLDRTAVAPLENGLAHFNKVVEQHPADAGARAARAAMWVESRDWDAAIAEASEAVRQNPQLIQGWLVRSAAHRGKKAFDAAQADAQTAIRLAPALVWGYVASGDACRGQGLCGRAVAGYTAALGRDPANPQLLLRRSEARLGTSQHEQWDQALLDLRQAISLTENDPECQRQCQLARGNTYIKLEDYSRALHEFDDLINRNSDDAGALIGRGMAYGYARQYQTALVSLNEAVYLEPKNAATYTARADIRTRQYNLRGALHDVDEALKLDPQCAAAYRVRGQALVKQRKWDAALEAFRQAIEIEPNNSQFYLARAAAYDAKKDGARAALDRHRATELDTAAMVPPSVATAAGAPASVAGKETARR